MQRRFLGTHPSSPTDLEAFTAWPSLNWSSLASVGRAWPPTSKHPRRNYNEEMESGVGLGH